MSFLSIVLFFLGISVLMIAWRLGNPSQPSSELLAALRGIAGLKRDLGYIRAELQETTERLNEHERRIEEKELSASGESSKMFRQTGDGKIKTQINDENSERQAEPYLFKDQHNKKDPIESHEIGSSILELNAVSEYEDVPRLNQRGKKEIRSWELPEKYRWVVELHRQGWSTLEIARHLAISQDAVNMVLNTYVQTEEG